MIGSKRYRLHKAFFANMHKAYKALKFLAKVFKADITITMKHCGYKSWVDGTANANNCFQPQFQWSRNTAIYPSPQTSKINIFVMHRVSLLITYFQILRKWYSHQMNIQVLSNNKMGKWVTFVIQRGISVTSYQRYFCS